MSLVHDALRKAEKDAERDNPKSAHMPHLMGTEKNRVPNTRIILLVAFLLCAAGIAIDLNFFHDPNAPKSTKVSLSSADLSNNGIRKAEVTRLKEAAQSAYKSGDLDVAWVSLSAAHRISKDDPEVLNNLGVISKLKGNTEDAKRYYEQALKIQPHYPECLNNLAVVNMEEGNNEEAKQNLLRANSIDPHHAETNFNLALVNERLGKNNEAIEYYMAFLKNTKNSDPTFLEEIRRHVVDIQE
jgi:Tfp pilus assembly protein PilF